jgi:hypothetical protein
MQRHASPDDIAIVVARPLGSGFFLRTDGRVIE